MIEHVWSILCTNSIIDQETNNVSLNNVIDQVTIDAEPIPGGVLPIKCDFMTTWIRKNDDQPAKGMFRIEFRSPSGKKTRLTEEFPIDLQQTLRYRFRVHLDGLLLEEPGRHVFQVELKDTDSDTWKEVAAIPLVIIFSQTQENKVEKKKSVRKSAKKK